MEDVHTSYLDRYDMGYGKPDTTIELLKKVVDDLHAGLHRQPTLLNAVGSIHFYSQTCLITKNG